VSRAEVGRPHETSYLLEEDGAVEAGWWTPDPRDLQFGEVEEEYLIDLLLGGSAADHPAGGGKTGGQEAPPQGEARENRPASGGEPKKAAAGKKEASDKGTSRREERPRAETEAEETGAQGGQGLKGWAPWWPSGREGGRPPHSLQGPETETKNNTGVRPGEATGT
jgi:hypothetical protein